MIARAPSFATSGEMLRHGLRTMRRLARPVPDTAYTTILTVGGRGPHRQATGIHRVHPTFRSYALTGATTNPILLLDMGARYGGYCADITRTFPVQPPTARQIDVYRSVLTLYTLGESMVRPGILYETIDAAVRQQLKMELQRLRFPHYANTFKYMPHSLGHSVGIEVHDTPAIQDIGPLQPNMVLTIEPGIYLDDMDIRIENTIRVTPDGCEVLSDGVPWDMAWFCRDGRAK